MKNDTTLMDYLTKLHTPASSKSYHYNVVRFLATNPDAETYGYQDVLDYLLQLKKQGKKDTYRAAVLAAIKKYYDYLLYREIRQDHPCRTLLIRDGRKKGINFEHLLSMQEMEQLLDREERFQYHGHRNRFMMSLLIYQGVTVHELIHLNVQDIDIDAATVTIRPSRRLSGRTLAMHPSQVVLAMRYLELCRPYLMRKDKPTNRLLITGRGGAETVDCAKSLFRPLRNLFPYKTVNAKNVRISVISYWLNERKLPLEDVQVMAGHRWPSSTEKYKREDMEEQRRVINAFHPLNSY